MPATYPVDRPVALPHSVCSTASGYTMACTASLVSPLTAPRNHSPPQVLDTVFVGPVAPGQYRFVFQVRHR